MKKILVFSIIFILLLSACAPSLTQSSEPPLDYASGELDMAYADEEYVTANSGALIPDSTLSQEIERVVIKNASIGIVVDDPAEMMAVIGRMAEDSGGFIVNSQLYKTQTDQGLEIPGADITIRVPADLLTETLAEIKSLLTDPELDVRYENVTGQDVTREYTDLQSRLANLEQAKVKLEEIMDEARQTEDVLSVYNQLTSVSEQIEVLKGQIQYYNEASRLSSIEVDIVAQDSIKELTIGGWQPAGVARKAIQALIDTLRFLADAAIWIALYILPVGLCLFIPVYLIYLGFRKLLRRRKQKILAEEKNKNENLMVIGEKENPHELE